MALEERTRGEEILIRLGGNGVVGAHYQTITEILRDGEVISANVNAPMSLNLVGEESPALSVLLGAVTARALEQVENAKVTQESQQLLLKDAHATIAELQGQIEALKARIPAETAE